jgi:hypothetical protein
VLSVGPKEEALKKDPRGVWGTAACWQHLDRTSDTSTVGSTQQRCVSRRFVKFVRLCAGPSSSSLVVLAAALHCFRFLSLSLSLPLPPILQILNPTFVVRSIWAEKDLTLLVHEVSDKSFSFFLVLLVPLSLLAPCFGSVLSWRLLMRFFIF